MRVHAQHTLSPPIIMFLTTVCAGTAVAGPASHQAGRSHPAAKGARAACEAVAAGYEQSIQNDVNAGEEDPWTPEELAKAHATIMTNCLKLGVNSSYVRNLEAAERE
jgi:hypothetical protein